MNPEASLFSRLIPGADLSLPLRPHLVIVFSFNDSSSRSVWAGFTLDWYRELLRDDLILDAFYTTLAVSVLAAVIATIAGTFAAIGFYNMKRRWRTPLMTVNNIPMMNADIVTGVSMCLFFVALLPCGDRLCPPGSTPVWAPICPPALSGLRHSADGPHHL